MKEELINIILNNEINVKGICNTSKREKLIELAISNLQLDPENWTKERYYGIKNYASFGDQREDHNYGMGPRHGTIVFQIGRDKNYKIENKDKYIEILLLARDYTKPLYEYENRNRYVIKADLFTLVKRYAYHNNEYLELSRLIHKIGESNA